MVAATAVIAPLAIAGAGFVLETEGFRPVILALVAVQTLAAIAFTTAGLRERGRIGGTVTA